MADLNHLQTRSIPQDCRPTPVTSMQGPHLSQSLNGPSGDAVMANCGSIQPPNGPYNYMQPKMFGVPPPYGGPPEPHMNNHVPTGLPNSGTSFSQPQIGQGPATLIPQYPTAPSIPVSFAAPNPPSYSTAPPQFPGPLLQQPPHIAPSLVPPGEHPGNISNSGINPAPTSTYNSNANPSVSHPAPFTQNSPASFANGPSFSASEQFVNQKPPSTITNGPSKAQGPYPQQRYPPPMYRGQQTLGQPHPGGRPPGSTRLPPPNTVTGISPIPPGGTSPSTGMPNRPNLLPLPFDSGKARTTASLTPTSASPGASEPTSSKSSRNPSPIPNQRYDAMEGQFSGGPSPSASYANLQSLNRGQPLGPGGPRPPTSTAPGPFPPPMVGTRAPVGPPPIGNHSPFPQPPPVRASIGLPPAYQVNSSQGPPPQVLPQAVSVPSSMPAAVTQSSSAFSGGGMPPGISSHPLVSQPMVAASSPAGQSVASSTSVASQPLATTCQPLATMPQISSAPPTQTSRPSGVTGRRQYPQQSPYSQAAMPPQGGMPTLHQSNAGYATEPSMGIPTSEYQKPTVNQPSTNSYPNNYVNSSVNQTFNSAQLTQSMGSLNLQGTDPVDLLQQRNILPPVPLEQPRIVLPQHDYKNINCNSEIFCCTLTKIPETQSLLQKSRLPLGILIHPFKDLNHLPVIQCNSIVRCRSCRTYINPFVYFVDHRRWKCNLCFRVNELPEEFHYDPVSKSYGDPSRRPEIKSSTIEFIAPSEYMLRPPQPAVYLFVLDVSHAATETGYLKVMCDTLLEELDKLPGDSRTQIGFITFDSSVHFYNLADGMSQPQMMVVSDIEEIFLPCPDNLLVNFQECKELVQDLLQQLPVKFLDNRDTDSALGAALQAAFKLMAPTGGRITVMQVEMPNVGPGALKPREDPNQRAGKDVQNLGPANDFYKKLSLDCSGQQVSVDLFVLASQYIDIATLSGISKYSGGCIHYFPGFHNQLNAYELERYENQLRRYLTRKIGFEAVMRIRCTKGLSIHTFHGNFFVRSTDLLSLPNINPDAGFGMQVSIEEQLTEASSACFQAALLYTSSKGERRIRVHTLCLPVSSNLGDILGGADQRAIVGLLAKMAVDRCVTSSMSDARDALMNACIDPLGVYKGTLAGSHGMGGLMAPSSLRLLPLYLLAMLKHVAFRVGTSTKLDERVFAMSQMKTLPHTLLMLSVYPSLYPVHALDEKNALEQDEKVIPQPPLLQLSVEKIDSHGAYVLDTGDHIYLYVCRAINDHFCQNVLKASNFAAIDERLTELPELETVESQRLRNFISHLQSQRPVQSAFHILRDDSKSRHLFIQQLIEDRSESTYSYYEFLQHLKQQITK